MKYSNNRNRERNRIDEQIDGQIDGVFDDKIHGQIERLMGAWIYMNEQMKNRQICI